MVRVFIMSTTGIENRGIDNRFFIRFGQACETAPVHQTLGMKLIFLGKGEAGLKISPGMELTTLYGRLHGGISAALADTAMGWAFITLGYTCVTVDMYTNYFAPFFAGDELTAEGKVIHLGKRSGVAEASLYNGQGELVAVSRGTFSLQKGVMQELEAMETR